MATKAFEDYMKVLEGSTGAKRAGLAASTQDKKRNLYGTPLNQGDSYGEGYSLIDGNPVSNRGSLYNENTGAQLGQGLSNLSDNQVYDNPNGDGTLVQRDPGTGEIRPYTGSANDLSHLYIGPSKTDPNIVKHGVSKYGVEQRFNKGQAFREGLTRNPDYGYPAGPEGIDSSKAYLNLRAPRDQVERFEELMSGNRGVIASKDMYDDGSPEAIARREALGPGASEYTRQDQNPLYNNKDENVRLGLQPDIPSDKKPTASEKRSLEMSKILGRNGGLNEDRATESIDALQYGVGSFAARAGDALIDSGTRVYMEGYKAFTGATEEETQKHITDSSSMFKRDKEGNFTGFDKYKNPEEYGYDNKRSQNAMKNLGKAFDSGDVLKMGSALLDGIIDAGPEFALESAGEILSTLNPLGLVAAASGYSNDTLEERAKNLDDGENLSNYDRSIGIATGVVMAAMNKLGGDEILGRSKVIKTLIGKLGETNSVSAMRSLVNGLGSRVLAMTGKGVYEGVEEIGQEFVQVIGEKFDTKAQEEIFSSETGKEMFQAFGGGLAGGVTMSSAGQIKSIPADVAKVSRAKGERDTGEYLVGEEGKLGKAFDDMTFKDTIQYKKDADQATTDMKNVDSFEQALEHENPIIRRAAEGIADIKDDKETEVGSEKHINNIAINIEKNAKAGEGIAEVSDFLDIDVSKASKEQIAKKIFGLSEENRQQLFEGFTVERTDRTASQKINDLGGFKEYKKKFTDLVNKHKEYATAKSNEFDLATKSVEEGRKSSPDVLKESKIDTGKIDKAEPKGLGKIIDIFTNKSTSDARKELNQYSEKSLKDALHATETPKQVKKYINQVLNKRRAATKRAKIDTGEQFSPRDSNFELYKGDKKKTLDALRKGLSKKQFTDTRDVKAMEDLVNSSLEQGFITDKQHEVFHNRLKKIGDNATEPTDVEKAAEEKIKTDTTEKTGFKEQTFKNQESAEVSKSEIEKEIVELTTTAKEISASVGEGEFTQEQKDKLDTINGRLQKIRKEASKFTEHEAHLNEAHSTMDETWFYEGATLYTVDNAFTKAEKEILGLC